MNNILDMILLKNPKSQEVNGVSGKNAATTVWLDRDLMEKVRDYAYTERITVKEAISRALVIFLEGKEIISRPKEEETERWELLKKAL